MSVGEEELSWWHKSYVQRPCGRKNSELKLGIEKLEKRVGSRSFGVVNCSKDFVLNLRTLGNQKKNFQKVCDVYSLELLRVCTHVAVPEGVELLSSLEDSLPLPAESTLLLGSRSVLWEARTALRNIYLFFFHYLTFIQTYTFFY